MPDPSVVWRKHEASRISMRSTQETLMRKPLRHTGSYLPVYAALMVLLLTSCTSAAHSSGRVDPG
jgi:hypothetical protein